jgi:tRNA (mo5U34)-methyltransferase
VNADLDAKSAVARVPFWWHSIDVGDGVVTPGHKSPDLLSSELEQLQLPDLTGQTVLDIGAWDGYFSFAAERLGARRVVALDHYVWSLDLGRQQEYYRQCLLSDEKPKPYETVPEFWQPDTLPGKAGFDTARALLGSGVEDVVGDFMAIDIAELGRFDITLFLGVLYHLRHPLLALERLRRVTNGTALIETAALVIRDHRDLSVCEFYETDELSGDVSNWWAPTAPALLGMIRAAGFSRAELLTEVPEPGDDPVIRYRLVARATV